MVHLRWLAGACAGVVLGCAGVAMAATGGDRPGVVLADDFEGQSFSPGGGLYYKHNFEQSAGRVEFQSRDVRFGRQSLALSVKGLCPKAKKGCSERAEVWEKKQYLLAYDEPVWYAFSMKLADPVPTDKHRYLMAQWKRQILPGATTSFSPFLALRLNKGKIIFTVETHQVAVMPLTGRRKNGCLAGETLVLDRPHDKQTRALVAWQPDMEPFEWRYYNGCTTAIRVERHNQGLPRATSGWIDFVVFIQTGPDGNGTIRIFANDEPVVTVSGHIGHQGAGLGSKQYFKFGPYRKGKRGLWTVLYDRFRRGPACENVGSPGLCGKIGTTTQ